MSRARIGWAIAHCAMTDVSGSFESEFAESFMAVADDLEGCLLDWDPGVVIQMERIAADFLGLHQRVYEQDPAEFLRELGTLMAVVFAVGHKHAALGYASITSTMTGDESTDAASDTWWADFDRTSRSADWPHSNPDG